MRLFQRLKTDQRCQKKKYQRLHTCQDVTRSSSVDNVVDVSSAVVVEMEVVGRRGGRSRVERLTDVKRETSFTSGQNAEMDWTKRQKLEKSLWQEKKAYGQRVVVSYLRKWMSSFRCSRKEQCSGGEQRVFRGRKGKGREDGEV